jgi:hypothetical protein
MTPHTPGANHEEVKKLVRYASGACVTNRGSSRSALPAIGKFPLADAQLLNAWLFAPGFLPSRRQLALSRAQRQPFETAMPGVGTPRTHADDPRCLYRRDALAVGTPRAVFCWSCRAHASSLPPSPRLEIPAAAWGAMAVRRLTQRDESLGTRPLVIAE